MQLTTLLGVAALVAGGVEAAHRDGKGTVRGPRGMPDKHVYKAKYHQRMHSRPPVFVEPSVWKNGFVSSTATETETPSQDGALPSGTSGLPSFQSIHGPPLAVSIAATLSVVTADTTLTAPERHRDHGGGGGFPWANNMTAFEPWKTTTTTTTTTSSCTSGVSTTTTIETVNITISVTASAATEVVTEVGYHRHGNTTFSWEHRSGNGTTLCTTTTSTSSKSCTDSTSTSTLPQSASSLSTTTNTKPTRTGPRHRSSTASSSTSSCEADSNTGIPSTGHRTAAHKTIRITLSGVTPTTSPSNPKTTQSNPTATGTTPVNSTIFPAADDEDNSENCVIDPFLHPAATGTTPQEKNKFAPSIIPTSTVCAWSAPSGRPSRENIYCGVRGGPSSSLSSGSAGVEGAGGGKKYFLGRFTENAAGVEVTLQECWQFCGKSTWGTTHACLAYEFHIDARGAPRCNLYGSNVAYALDAVDSQRPEMWFDLECGDPRTTAWHSSVEGPQNLEALDHDVPRPTFIPGHEWA